jgi:type III restriction protein res subunit
MDLYTRGKITFTEGEIHMNAKGDSIAFLGELKELKVPFFQRHYVWQKENWEELLQSFQNTDAPPFLGSIILKDKGLGDTQIIDGQQRLTTITILAKALYDSLPDEKKNYNNGIYISIRNYLFYKRNDSDDFLASKPRITHSYYDQEYYSMVIKASILDETPIDLSTIKEDSNNILKCYKYYREYLNGKSVDAINQLFNSIFDRNKKVIVLIILNNNDEEEQRIFDTINRAGVRLSSADIIKNNLFEKLLKSYPNDEVTDLYQKYWNDIFYNDNDRKLWDSTRIFGNVERTNLEFLLYCVATIKWGKDDNIFRCLDKTFSQNTEKVSDRELKKLVVDISCYANIFKKCILDLQEQLKDTNDPPRFKYTEKTKLFLFILEKFGVQMFYPYILKRIKDVDANFEDSSLIHDFKILESFIVRRRISGKGTQDYVDKCNALLRAKPGKEIDDVIIPELSKSDSKICDDDIKVYLQQKINVENAKTLLYIIELYMRDKDDFTEDSSLLSNLTLEHIMPTKWEKHWSDVDVVDKSGNKVSDADKMQCRKEAIGCIGNMTLLTHKLNSSTNNKSFATKVCDAHGYKNYSSLKLTCKIVDSYKQNPVWNEQQIYNRADRICDLFLQLWPNYSAKPIEAKPIETKPIKDIPDEAFDDPITLMNALSKVNYIDDEDDSTQLISKDDFIKRINIQRKTFDKYINEQKIVPDKWVKDGNSTPIPYFTQESFDKYVNQFNWTVITPDNIKEIFMEMVEQMEMQRSYKPLFLKAVMENASDSGIVPMKTIVAAFRNFYTSRANKRLLVERDDSIFARSSFTDEEAKREILRYPLDRFAQRSIVEYIECLDEVELNPSLWKSLNNQEKKRVITICEKKLNEYYSGILVT